MRKNNLFSLEFIKYIVIGGLNTLFYYTCYSLLIYFNFSYILAVFLATFLTSIISFKSFGTYVFYNKDNKLFYKFILLTLVNYLLNIFFISIFSQYGLSYYLAGLISAIIVALNSFLINKFVIFKKLK